jgi:hypothetical protein
VRNVLDDTVSVWVGVRSVPTSDMHGEASVCRSQRIRGWWFESAGFSSSLAQGARQAFRPLVV